MDHFNITEDSITDCDTTGGYTVIGDIGNMHFSDPDGQTGENHGVPRRRFRGASPPVCKAGNQGLPLKIRG